MDATPTSSAPATSPTQDILKRLRARFSQTELARRSGIPQPRLSRWESHGVPDAADDALKLLELEKSLDADTTQQAG